MRRTKLKPASGARETGPRELHPVERFRPGNSIQAGSALKDLFDSEYVGLLCESLETHWPQFDAEEFRRHACSQLDRLELKARTQQIAAAMSAQLPDEFAQSASLLLKTLGPELNETEGNGLTPFFYLPHSSFLEKHPALEFESGMQLNYELTKRFTAEFSIRRFVIEFTDRALRLLMKWTTDRNPHVRRLVSEGTRSRLPWGLRLKIVQQNPDLTIPLLEKLKDDPELYVRRSVANHLGDMLKDAPDVAFQICREWVDEARSFPDDDDRRKNRFWMIRHAVRHPAKQGNPVALKLRRDAQR